MKPLNAEVLHILAAIHHWSSSVEFTITYYDTSWLWHTILVAKTAIYPVMCQFPLFVAMC